MKLCANSDNSVKQQPRSDIDIDNKKRIGSLRVNYHRNAEYLVLSLLIMVQTGCTIMYMLLITILNTLAYK